MSSVKEIREKMEDGRGRRVSRTNKIQVEKGGISEVRQDWNGHRNMY